MRVFFACLTRIGAAAFFISSALQLLSCQNTAQNPIDASFDVGFTLQDSAGNEYSKFDTVIVQINQTIAAHLEPDNVPAIKTASLDFGDGTVLEFSGLKDTVVSKTYMKAGKYAVKLSCEGTTGKKDRQSLLVRVNARPRIIEDSIPRSAVIGERYAVQVPVSDSDDASVQIKLLARPAGMTVAGDSLVWKPASAQAGQATVVVAADDGSGGSDTATVTITVTTKAGSLAFLDSLKVSKGTLEPGFAANTFTYALQVNIGDTAKITPVPIAAAAIVVAGADTIGPSCPSAMMVGDYRNNGDTLTLSVSGPGDTASTKYRLILSVAGDTLAGLAGLAVNGAAITPSFDPVRYRYSAAVWVGTRITLLPTAKSFGATIKVEGTTVVSGAVSPVIAFASAQPAVDTVLVEVIEADGVRKTIYTLLFQKTSVPAKGLSGLLCNGASMTPDFNPEVTIYSISAVAGDTVTVVPSASDTAARILIDGAAVKSGVASVPLAATTETGKVAVVPMVVTEADGVTKTTYTLLVARVASSNAELSQLAFTKGTVSPVFNKDSLKYSLTLVDGDTVAVMPTAANRRSVISVNGTAVSSGAASKPMTFTDSTKIDTIKIAVVAQDGITSRSYTVLVRKTFKPRAQLLALTLSRGTLSPAFAAGVTKYYTIITGGGQISVTPTTADAQTTLTVNGQVATSETAFGPITLSGGDNTIDTITVVASKDNGQLTTSYTVLVFKKPLQSAQLRQLVVSGAVLEPAFDPMVLSYNVKVIMGYSINFTPFTYSDSAQLLVNGAPAVSGTATPPRTYNDTTKNDTILFEVSSTQTGLKTVYSVVVQIIAIPRVVLSNLLVVGATLDKAFNPDSLTYSVTIPDGAYLRLRPYTNVTNADITVGGVKVASGALSAALMYIDTTTVDTVDVKVATPQGFSNTYYVLVHKSANTVGLSSLNITGATISPAFKTTIYSYTDTVTVSQLTMELTSNPPNAVVTVSLNGFQISPANGIFYLSLLQDRQNNISIMVFDPSNSLNASYTIPIYRARSADAGLDSLKFTWRRGFSWSTGGVLTPVFAKATLNYTVSTYDTIVALDIRPTLGAQAAVTIDDAAAGILSVGSTVYPCTLSVADTVKVYKAEVTAEDGTTKQTYTVTVTKIRRSSVFLSGLGLLDGSVTVPLTPVFSRTDTGYTASSYNDILQLTPSIDDSLACYQKVVSCGGTVILPVAGRYACSLSTVQTVKTYDITLTAEDRTTVKTYHVAVTRNLRSYAFLTDATVTGSSLDTTFFQHTLALSPVFAQGTFAYTLSTYDDSLNFTASLPDSIKATVALQIGGVPVAAADTLPVSFGKKFIYPVNLDKSSPSKTVTMTVTAENGTTTQTYTVATTRLVNGDNDLYTARLTDTIPYTGDSIILTPAFTPATISYSAYVNGNLTSLKIGGYLSGLGYNLNAHFRSQIAIGDSILKPAYSAYTGKYRNIPLSIGNNPIALKVTSEDGALKTYTFNVYRPVVLSGLTPSAGSLDSLKQTDSNTFSYNLNIQKFINTVSLKPAADYGNTIKVNGVNVALGAWSSQADITADGSTIRVTITNTLSSDSTVYTVTVKKDKWDFVPGIALTGTPSGDYVRANNKLYFGIVSADSGYEIKSFDGTAVTHICSYTGSAIPFAVNSAGVVYGVIYKAATGLDSMSVIAWNSTGSTWDTVGTPRSILGSSTYRSRALDFDNSDVPYIAYAKNTSNKAIVRKYDAGAWTQVGDTISVGAANSISLAVFGNAPFIGFADVANSNKAVVYRYSGSAWELSTYENSALSGPIQFRKSGITRFLCVFQNSSYYYNAKSFNGSTWDPVISNLSITHYGLSLIPVDIGTNNLEFLENYSSSGYVWNYDEATASVSQIGMSNFEGSTTVAALGILSDVPYVLVNDAGTVKILKYTE